MTVATTKCTKPGSTYRDKVAALMALAKLQRQDKPGHSERRAYCCHLCHKWHLTSKA